jgi:signal transduction histidine kinase
MSLRARLTLIYGGLLALVFVGLGYGAETVMQTLFSDQARSSVTSAATYVINHYTCVSCGGATSSKLYRYALPKNPQPFANVYLELVAPGAKVYDRSANLESTQLPVNMKDFNQALSKRQTSFEQTTFGGTLLDIYYTPMPKPPPSIFFRVEPDVLLVGKSQSDVSHALDVFNAALFSGEAFIWILAVVVTWLVSGSALRPINAITERAASIADTSDFAGRVPVDTRTAELQTLAITFNRMLESLDKAYAHQQRFLADASHELRTPLTVLQGNLHFLEQAVDAPDSDRWDALHAARIEADRMGLLVSDLLALSRADAGTDISREPVELDRVVIDGFKRIQSRERLANPDRESRLKLGRLEETVVEGDYERLLQLVVILLDNAVKYTPEAGSIEVELVREKENLACVYVSDTGVGISPEDREHVFERFYRSKKPHSQIDGSGLGLSIAQWIVEAHNGQINFVGRPDGGTTFTVSLPLAVTASPSTWE